MNVTDCPFTEDDVEHAYKTWRANCGPAALAFALGIHIDDVRGTIPGFEERGYTNPTMMRAALSSLNATWFNVRQTYALFHTNAMSLVRVQWRGPWTAPGANPRWAYRYTHWIATWQSDAPHVFDINSGIVTFEVWQQHVVKEITQTIPRADGGWFSTHILRVNR